MRDNQSSILAKSLWCWDLENKKKERKKKGRKEGTVSKFEVVCKNQHKMNEKNIGNY